MNGEAPLSPELLRKPDRKKTWIEYLESLPNEVRFLFTHTHIKNEGIDIANAIRQHVTVVVEDASVEQ